MSTTSTPEYSHMLCGMNEALGCLPVASAFCGITTAEFVSPASASATFIGEFPNYQLVGLISQATAVLYGSLFNLHGLILLSENGCPALDSSIDADDLVQLNAMSPLVRALALWHRHCNPSTKTIKLCMIVRVILILALKVSLSVSTWHMFP